jgi:hypothetical protein
MSIHARVMTQSRAHWVAAPVLSPGAGSSGCFPALPGTRAWLGRTLQKHATSLGQAIACPLHRAQAPGKAGKQRDSSQ